MRIPRALRTVAASAALALSLAVLAGCGSSSSSSEPSAPGAHIGSRLDSRLASSVLDLPLVDSDHNVHHLSDFAGKVVVISDTLTLCQESCPLDTSTLVQTARAVDKAGLGKDVVFLSITVDPHRDTPKQLAAYRHLFAPAPKNWLTLTGSADDIDRLWDHLGVFRKHVPSERPLPHSWRTGKPLHYDVQHSDEVFFVDTRSHERFVLEGVADVGKRSAVPKPLYHYLSEEGRHNVAHPKRTAWTEPQALRVLGWLTGQHIA